MYIYIYIYIYRVNPRVCVCMHMHVHIDCIIHALLFKGPRGQPAVIALLIQRCEIMRVYVLCEYRVCVLCASVSVCTSI